MAAVVASLAAFVAGCGLPGLPLGFGGDDRVSQDHADSERRTLRSSNVAAANGRPNEAEESGSNVWCSAHTAEQCVAISSKGQFDVPTMCGSCADNVSGSRRHVRFDLGMSTVHEVIPYAEVYGVHPRFLRVHRRVSTKEKSDVDAGETLTADFVYLADRRKPTDKRDGKRLAASKSEDTSDSDEDDEFGGDGSLRDIALRTLTGVPSKLPWPLWCVICVLCFLLRVFGMQVFMELLCPADSGCCRSIGASFAGSIGNAAFLGWA